MLFGRNYGADAEEFWKNREEDLGMPILAKVLGRVIRENTPAPLWGLFYTTEKALYFQTFRSENWLSFMFSGGKKGSGRTKDETIEIPTDTIEIFRVKPKKNGLMKFFHQPPLVELRWKSAISGVVEEMVFEMEGDADAFVSSVTNID